MVIGGCVVCGIEGVPVVCAVDNLTVLLIILPLILIGTTKQTIINRNSDYHPFHYYYFTKLKILYSQEQPDIKKNQIIERKLEKQYFKIFPKISLKYNILKGNIFLLYLYKLVGFPQPRISSELQDKYTPENKHII